MYQVAGLISVFRSEQKEKEIEFITVTQAQNIDIIECII